ncbi:Plasmodium variant antigen protein Cir/Yir/Bir, putative [Plasmodium chabaudi adami]|uniref:Plasmodium variant antigen protein Cir/Yir/Bir, putative n=1 Tax=Plasmodium chabaudi adami TaxID=5826 RepID=A0A1D3LC45_PLACE|nr:Plasmodium variant antigen protein Cir/Yir/Bir, putative [Plasmodium chabaudi adami]
MCEFLIEADSYFNDSIKKVEYNDYDECFLMWLSDKLFKMHIESIGKQNIKDYIDGTTLNQAYEKYLKKHKVILDYWVLFDNIKGLKGANLRYMSEFYKLLNNICKTIADYNDNGTESPKLSKYSKNCLNQYRTLYIKISECKSYLHLLKKLKGIYDDFRVSAIEENRSNNNLATKLQTLTTPNGVEIDGTKNFILYEFSKKKCNSLDKKAASVQLQSSSKEESPLPQEPEKKESAPQSSELQQAPTALPAPPQVQKQDLTYTPPSPEQSKDQSSEQKDSDDSDNDRDGTDSDPVEDGSKSTERDLFNTGPLIFRISLKGMEKLNDGITWFEMIKNKFICATKHIHNLYNTTLPSIQNAFNKSIDFSNHIINNISTDSNEVDPLSDSDDSESGSGGEMGDQSPPQKDSPQTSSGNHNSDKSDQEPEKPVEGPVITSEHPGREVKGNGTIGIGDIFIFKEFKKIGIPIIVIIISITLAIMYKFLAFERRKKLKRKKMKKVTNSFGVNKTT